MDVDMEYWLRFGVNIAIISLVIAALYWRRKPDRNYALALIVGGALVYVIIRLLAHFEIGLGVGFGIFAVSSLLRFRTVTMSLRDMTYLFSTITLSLVNVLLMSFGTWAEVAAVNLAIVATLFALEYNRFPRRLSSMQLAYDSLELLHPHRRAELEADIQARAGVAPVRIAINRVNLKSQSARLHIWYSEEAD